MSIFKNLDLRLFDSDVPSTEGGMIKYWQKPDATGPRFYVVDQGSADWIAIRLGVPTASNMAKIITPAKGQPSAQRFQYMYCLVAETLTGKPTESFVETEWMARGKLLEPKAAGAYEDFFDVTTVPVGFVTTANGLIGASPDRLIVHNGRIVGGLEIKCPAPQTQIGYWAEGFGDDYKVQCAGQCFVAEFGYVDRWAWHPQFPPATDRLVPDPDFTLKLDAALLQFNRERLDLIERLRDTGMFPDKAQPLTPIEAAMSDEEEIEHLVANMGASNVMSG